MALTDAENLRDLLGEPIPDGGTDADTLFSNEKIDDLLLDANNNIERAAYQGWRKKAAILSNLVDTTEGNTQKKFSQLLGGAADMIKLYGRSSSGPTEGRARVGRLSRPPVPWD